MNGESHGVGAEEMIMPGDEMATLVVVEEIMGGHCLRRERSRVRSGEITSSQKSTGRILPMSGGMGGKPGNFLMSGHELPLLCNTKSGGKKIKATFPHGDLIHEKDGDPERIPQNQTSPIAIYLRFGCMKHDYCD